MNKRVQISIILAILFLLGTGIAFALMGALIAGGAGSYQTADSMRQPRPDNVADVRRAHAYRVPGYRPLLIAPVS